jgi:methionyl-tRNA formyltransferase
MRITIFTDNPNSWIMPYVNILKKELVSHEISHVKRKSEIIGGDIMFILSCESILKSHFLSLHKNNIVVHPSKVPHGKGWSPLAWQILEGKNKIPVSLFEAVEKVDAGDVYLVDYIELFGHELNDEIKHQQGLTTIRMILKYLDEYNNLIGTPQSGEETFYKKRDINSNEIDIFKSISEQFNLLRIVDNERYPAFFIKDNKKYFLKIYKDQF